MTITHDTFGHLLRDALETVDKDLYIAELSSSSLLIDPEDESEPDWDAIVSLLSNTWELAHMSIRSLCERGGLSQVDLARRFQIPLRTVQSWACGERDCPVYTKLMMAELLNICPISRT